MTLSQSLNQIPPPIARLLCPLTEREIATKSGLSVRTVRRISNQANWNKHLKVISVFLESCGIEFHVKIPALNKMKRIIASKRGLRGVKHLRRHSQKAKAILRVLRTLQ